MANHQACKRDCGGTDCRASGRAPEPAYSTAPFRVLQERTCCDGLCQQGRQCPRTNQDHHEECRPANALEAATFYALLVVLLIVLIGVVSATVLVFRDPARALELVSQLFAVLLR